MNSKKKHQDTNTPIRLHTRTPGNHKKWIRKLLKKEKNSWVQILTFEVIA